jgi:hypothetical protein
MWSTVSVVASSSIAPDQNSPSRPRRQPLSTFPSTTPTGSSPLHVLVVAAVMGLYHCRRQHRTPPWRRMRPPLSTRPRLGSPRDRHVMGRTGQVSLCPSFALRAPLAAALASCRPSSSPRAGVPRWCTISVVAASYRFSDQWSGLRLHRPSLVGSCVIDVGIDKVAPSSSPTMLHGTASGVPGDARMLFPRLFAGTSIYVGSSSPLLTGRFCHRHHHRRPLLTRRQSGQPIARATSPSHDVYRLTRVSSPSTRVATAWPPRAAVWPVVDSTAAAPPQ